MSINFKDLKNNPNDRRIREVIPVGGKSIKVFEPSEDNINKIISMQEDFMKVLQGESVEEKTVEFSGQMIIKELVPLLTDVTGVEDMTDDEINDVVSNPSIGLQRLVMEIEGIITEIFSLVLANARYDILAADFNANQFLLTQDTVNRTLKLTDKINGNDDLSQKINQSQHNLERALNAKDAKELADIVSENNKARNNVKSISEYMGIKKEEKTEEKELDEVVDTLEESKKEDIEDIKDLDVDERIGKYSDILKEYRHSFENGNGQSLFDDEE